MKCDSRVTQPLTRQAFADTEIIEFSNVIACQNSPFLTKLRRVIGQGVQ